MRRANLRQLVKEFADGSLVRFVEVTLGGLTSYKGLQRVTGSRPLRNLGSGTARQIEQRLDLPRGWLDQDRSGAAPTNAVLGGKGDRTMRLAQSIESLPPTKRQLVEQLVSVLSDQKPKRRRKKTS